MRTPCTVAALLAATTSALHLVAADTEQEQDGAAVNICVNCAAGAFADSVTIPDEDTQEAKSCGPFARSDYTFTEGEHTWV